MKHKLLLILGFLLLGLAFIGIFIPVLPTTPFVLVAAGCFTNSPKIYGWLCNSKMFKEYIENYKNGGGITTKTRRNSLCFLWTALGVSALIFRRQLVWGILLLVGIAVTIHIMTIAKKSPFKTLQIKTAIFTKYADTTMTNNFRKYYD